MDGPWKAWRGRSIREQLIIWIYNFLNSLQSFINPLLRPIWPIVPPLFTRYIIQLCVRASVRACLPACWWESRWQLHNSSNSTVDAGVLLLCYKHDKSLNHSSLIVPWAPNTSACVELIVTQRESTDSPRASRNYMCRDGAHLLNSRSL